jgi:hypothetical protein
MENLYLDIVVARIARRARISLAAARVIAELAGIGRRVRG